MRWDIYIGGKPTIIVEASSIWLAAAQFVIGVDPEFDRSDVEGKLHRDPMELRIEFRDLRFSVRPHQEMRRAA